MWDHSVVVESYKLHIKTAGKKINYKNYVLSINLKNIVWVLKTLKVWRLFSKPKGMLLIISLKTRMKIRHKNYKISKF